MNRSSSLFVSAWLFWVVLTSGCASLEAHSRAPHGSYDVEVSCEFGTCSQFVHRGQRYVVAQFGSAYTIRVWNHSARWVEAVVTVDGKDVINGSPGSFDNRGYLIEPYSYVNIDGWRTSMNDVAAFRFTSTGDSYAARTGAAQHVGVIGVAIFPERRQKNHPRPIVPRWTPDPDPFPTEGYAPSPRGAADEASSTADGDHLGGAEAAAKSSSPYRYRREERRQNVGTQYGESRHSSASFVDFVRANHHSPEWKTTLRYDDAAGLRSKGIWAPTPQPIRPSYPDDFPPLFAPPP